MSNLEATLRATMTPTKLRAWGRANHDLAMTVLKAQAFASVERERVNAYVAPIFVRYAFTDDHDPARRVLTEPREIYLSEDDSRVETYFGEVQRAHFAHGWTGNPEHCPALVAEDLQRQAEQLLLHEMGKLVGCDGGDFCITLDLRAKALEWALAVCIGGVK